MYMIDWFGTIEFEGANGRGWRLQHLLADGRLVLTDGRPKPITRPVAALHLLDLLLDEAVRRAESGQPSEGVTTIYIHNVLWGTLGRRDPPVSLEELPDGRFTELAPKTRRAISDLNKIVGPKTIQNVGKAYRFAGKKIKANFEKRPEPKSERPTLLTLDFFPKPEDAVDLVQLLDPRFRAVEFIGQAALADSLWAWLTEEAQAPRVSVKVVASEAGAGKTRLAYRLLELIQHRIPGRWHAGLPAASLSDLFSNGAFYEHCQRQPTLIIVDDAALYVNELIKVVAEFHDRHEQGPRLCFLLLERAAHENYGWFRRLTDALVVRSPRIISQPTLVLAEPDVSQRRQLFENALNAAAKILKTPPLTLAEPIEEYFATLAMANTLAVLLAALTSQERQEFTPAGFPVSELAAIAAARESNRIRSIAASANCSERFLLHMAAFASLTRGLTREELVLACHQESEELEPTPHWSAIDFAEILETLVLPSMGGRGMAPIVPEIVGRAFAESLLDDYDEPCDILVRAVRFKPTSTAFTLTQFHPTWTYLALEEVLIYPDTRSLSRLKRLAGRDPALRAELAHNLYARGVLLSVKAQEEQAAKYFDESFQIFEALPDARSCGRFFFGYADLLKQRGTKLLDQRTPAEALPFLEKGVSLYRYAAEHSKFGPRHGRWQSREEIPIHRKRYPETLDPHVYSTGLADLLMNLGLSQGRCGNGEQAFATINEAITELRSVLHAPSWDAVEKLAICLAVQSELAHKLGDLTTARRAFHEAGVWYFELSRLYPRRFALSWSQTQLGLVSIAYSHPNIQSLSKETVDSILDEAGRIRNELLSLRPAEKRVFYEPGEPFEPAGEVYPIVLLKDPTDDGVITVDASIVSFANDSAILQAMIMKTVPAQHVETLVDNRNFGAGPVVPEQHDPMSPLYYKPWFRVWFERIYERFSKDVGMLVLLLNTGKDHAGRLATQNAELFAPAQAHWDLQSAALAPAFGNDRRSVERLIDAAQLNVSFFHDNRRRADALPFATLVAMPILKQDLVWLSLRIKGLIEGSSYNGTPIHVTTEEVVALIRIQIEIDEIVAPAPD